MSTTETEFYDDFDDYDEYEYLDDFGDCDINYCYECGGYGHDWSIDENGELVSNCDGCPFNKRQKKGETE